MRSDVGRVRSTNEDAFLVADIATGPIVAAAGLTRFEVGPQGALLSVSDGMGGHDAGEVASALTLASLLRNLGGLGGPAAPDAVVEQAVQHANREVHAAGDVRGGVRRMGATLTALVVQGANAYIAEIGDSRAYVLRGGTLRLVTRDQSLAQALLDAGGLSSNDAANHPMRNHLLQAMGQRPDVTVALSHLALRRRDCLILCSDGLWSAVSESEIRDVILGSATLDVAAERLVALANERGGKDNVTVVLAGVGGDLPEASTEERISDTFAVLQSFDAAAKRVTFAAAAPEPGARR
jgi:serine/threonine protein phosphatase PrpC